MDLQVLIAPTMELDQCDRVLIEECAERLLPGTTYVLVSLLQRYGYSGARLYQMRCGSRHARPFVVKIHRRVKMLEELSNTSRVSGIFEVDRVELVEPPTPMSDLDEIALVYPAVSSSADVGEVEVSELGDHLFDLERRTAIDVIESLYEDRFRYAHARMEARVLAWQSAFGRYLRLQETDPVLDQIFGGGETVAGVGNRIHDPRHWLALSTGEAAVHHSGIHGDLHAQNVVLDRTGTPHLIDYAWADTHGPTLVDFTLMETTVRLMRFPRHVNPHNQTVFQDALNSEYGYIVAPRLMEERDDPMVACYRRAARLIGKVRAAATRACGADWNYTEYQQALFATMFGMVAYDSYPLLYTLHALDSLGQQLAA